MRTIGLFEAKNRLSELTAAAERGEVVAITRHGKIVARLMPPEDPEALARARHLKAMEEIKALRATLKDRMTIDEILAARHEGHRY